VGADLSSGDDQGVAVRRPASSPRAVGDTLGLPALRAMLQRLSPSNHSVRYGLPSRLVSSWARARLGFADAGLSWWELVGAVVVDEEAEAVGAGPFDGAGGQASVSPAAEGFGAVVESALRYEVVDAGLPRRSGAFRRACAARRACLTGRAGAIR